MKQKKGFTLIELLVVISIIALLLSILMPGLRKAKKVARTITCRTNVRSLGLGFRTYVESNDQKGFVYNSQPYQNLWLLEIESQVGEIDKVRYCPETKLMPGSKAPYNWPDGIGNSRTTWAWPYHLANPSSATPETVEFGSYATNWWMYSDKTEPMAWRTVNPPNSSNVPIFVDCKWIDFIPQNNQPCPQNINLDEGGGVQSILGIIMNRHGKETNVGFVDGHVASVPLESLWSLKWGKNFETQAIMTRPDGSPVYQK